MNLDLIYQVLFFILLLTYSACRRVPTGSNPQKN